MTSTHTEASQPLHAARLKMDRAETHLHEVSEIIRDFMATNPYSMEATFDADDHRHTFRIKAGQIPKTLSVVVGDCIHAFRSALDLMAVELTQEGLRRKNQDMSRTIFDNAGFPIFATKELFAEKGMSKAKHWPSVAQDLLKTLEPAKDGGHEWSLPVWQIHQLDILDKHKLLIPVAALFGGENFFVGFSEETVRKKGTVHARIQPGPLVERKFPIQDGEIYFTVWSEHSELQYEMGGHIDIAFGQKDIIEGAPITETLVNFGNIVNSIIETMAVDVFDYQSGSR